MQQKKVLITGMSGLIGGAVRRQLEGKYQLSALNRRDVPGVECYQADIGDLAAIQPAFAHKDVVVHLAAIASGTASWEEVLHHNIIGTYNVFEAARQAGVKRIVYASSGATVAGWEQEFPYKAIVEGRYEEVPPDWP
ncbi:MAG: NAD(P)-dependent oxidoreductase, partial [Nitrospinota bacterium]